MPEDRSIADLLATIARQYHKQIEDEGLPIDRTRLEIIRRLELITQSIRSLIRHEQSRIAWPSDKRDDQETAR